MLRISQTMHVNLAFSSWLRYDTDLTLPFRFVHFDGT